jgi:hypothetical protein
MTRGAFRRLLYGARPGLNIAYAALSPHQGYDDCP